MGIVQLDSMVDMEITDSAVHGGCTQKPEVIYIYESGSQKCFFDQIRDA